jgi:hypothetical protein
METDEIQEVLVHTDRRACVSSPILHNFAKACGLEDLPEKVYAARTDNGFVLRWRNFEGSKNYDLSIRDRVLIGGFKPGQRLVANVTGDALIVEGATPVSIRGARQGNPQPKPIAKKRKKRSKKETKMKTQQTTRPPNASLETSLKPGICADVAQNYRNLSLLEAARVLNQFLPGITVGDLVDAKGASAPLFGIMLQQAGVSVPKSAAKTNGHAKAKPASNGQKKAIEPAELLHSIQSTGKDGASIHDLVQFTHKKLSITRDAVRRLIETGKVKKKGNTRAARYYATA